MEKSTFNYKVIVKTKDFTLCEITGTDRGDVVKRVNTLCNTFYQFSCYNIKVITRNVFGVRLSNIRQDVMPRYIGGCLYRQYNAYLNNDKYEINLLILKR